MREGPETHAAPSRSGFPRGEEVTMRCQELEVPYGNHTAAAAALDAHARAAVAGDQAERVVRTLQHTVTPLVPFWACPFPGRA